MDVLAANIPVEIAKAPNAGITGKLSGSTNKTKDRSSFANILNSAASPTCAKGETDKKADDKNNINQSARPNGDLIPLFSALSPMPVTLGGSAAKDNVNFSGSATDAVLNPSGEAILDQANSQGLFTMHQSARQTVLSSEVDPQVLDNNAGNVNNHTAVALKSEQQQSGIIQATVIPATSNQNGVANQMITVNQQSYREKEPGRPNPDDQVKQEAAKAALQSLSVVQSRSTSDNMLKPLESLAAYQSATLISANNEANKNLPADKAEQTAAALPNKDSKVSPNTMIVAPSATSTGQETKNGGLLFEQNLSETKAVENISDKPMQSFQHILHQTSNKAQAEVVEIASQPTPQLQQDTNNVLGQIVEHARLIKSPDMSEMVIKLKPEHLGELTLKVAVDNGVVSASFHTNNSEVRGIIEASVQQLRQDMAQQGLKVEYVGVYAGLGQPFSNGQGEANKQQSWKPQTTKKSSNDEFSESLEAIEAAGAKSSDSGVDYRI